MGKETIKGVKEKYEGMIKNLQNEIDIYKQEKEFLKRRVESCDISAEEKAKLLLERDELIAENGVIRTEWQTTIAARHVVEHENELLKNANTHLEETLKPYFVSCSYNHGNKQCLIDRLRLHGDKLDLELKNEAYRIVVADLMEKRNLPKVTPEPNREFVKTLHCTCGKTTPLRADDDAVCAHCGNVFY